MRSLLFLGVLLVSVPASAAGFNAHHAARRATHAHASSRRVTDPRRRRGNLKAMVPAGETLLTVSCSIARSCVTTGADETSLGPRSLAEQWNGVAWRFGVAGHPQRAAGSILSAASCAARRTCFAVGAGFDRAGRSSPLAEVWNGSRWSVLTVPSPPARRGIGSALLGVSCPSPTVCLAVGDNQTRSGVVTLAERWDGRGWRILRTPSVPRARTSLLTAVSCSAATACTAVGTYVDVAHIGFALTERWNGARWLMQAAANIAPAGSNALSGVSCPAARTCVAVGSAQGASGAALTEEWNGAAWRLLPSPIPASAAASTLAGASCQSATRCQAVGYYQLSSGTDLTLIAAWNGNNWTIERSASRGIASELFSVSCPAARRCVAVGGYGVRSGTRLTLAEVWDGTRWRLQRLPTN